MRDCCGNPDWESIVSAIQSLPLLAAALGLGSCTRLAARSLKVLFGVCCSGWPLLCFDNTKVWWSGAKKITLFPTKVTFVFGKRVIL